MKHGASGSSHFAFLWITVWHRSYSLENYKWLRIGINCHVPTASSALSLPRKLSRHTTYFFNLANLLVNVFADLGVSQRSAVVRVNFICERDGSGVIKTRMKSD
jgi:hypothetical protein